MSIPAEAAYRGALKTAEQNRAERESRWEDIDFLLDAGYSPHHIANRMGVSATALSRQAYRQAELEETEIWYDRARRFNYSRKQAA